LKNPYELLRSGWIRPEDQSYYEEAGVDVIKITERYDSTETLITKARAYLTQNYSGNFFDLLSLHPRRSGKISAVKTKRYLNKAGLLQQAKIHKLLEELPELYLDNRQLDGFLSYFLEKDCEDLLCSECGHCAKFAAKIFATGLPEAVARIEGLLASMQSGELFSSEKD
jgi:collagenase-like PrtC family protease